MAIKVQAGSSILYHVTKTPFAANILMKDRFEMKPSEGTGAEEESSRGKYYLSCARSRLSVYIQKEIYQWSTVLVLDGQALAARYRVEPVDYWGTLKMLGDRLRNRELYNEMEDRVFSPTPFIPHATKYIKAVHSFLLLEPKAREPLLRIRKACLLHHIPSFFYSDWADLKVLNTKQAVPFVVPPKESKPSDSGLPSSYWATRIRDNYLYRWIALYYTPIDPHADPKGNENPYFTAQKLPHDGKAAYKKLAYQDCVQGFEADLHNAKSASYGHWTKEREALDTLVGIMRKNKWTPKEFLEALRCKWYPQRYTK